MGHCTIYTVTSAYTSIHDRIYRIKNEINTKNEERHKKRSKNQHTYLYICVYLYFILNTEHWHELHTTHYTVFVYECWMFFLIFFFEVFLTFLCIFCWRSTTAMRFIPIPCVANSRCSYVYSKRWMLCRYESKVNKQRTITIIIVFFLLKKKYFSSSPIWKTECR